jgi:stearoyl-CoA desaturase (delta-9 desaturase)
VWAHIGWITSRKNFPTDYRTIPDLAKFPELVFLNRFDLIVPILLALSLYATGGLLEHFAPGLHTTGGQMLVWGFFVSTTFLFHGTACINSFTHLWGKRRFNTTDDSRNSLILALITLGEGWHNNHHRYQACTRQGFYWWEIDITYYGLKALSWTGFIWDLKPVPKSILEEAARIDHANTVAAAQRAAHHNPDYSYGTLKKVMPAAAAIAVATATASQVTIPKKADGPAIHKDVTEETHPNARQSQPPASTPARDS